MSPKNLGLSHYSPPPQEFIAPHYGMLRMIAGAVFYLTTKLGRGYNGKDPKVFF